MKLKNDRGFTLLELLVSIFILTTVILIGYRVINKSIFSVKEQGNINKGQMIMNNINDYLTRDLESSKSISLFINDKEIVDTSIDKQDSNKSIISSLEDGNGQVLNYIKKLELKQQMTYKYVIKGNKKYSEYNINIDKEDENKVYVTISRIDSDGVNIDFINHEKIESDSLPFSINGNDPYKVNMSYNISEKKYHKYEFEITSRLYKNDGESNIPDIEPPKPPELPDIVPPEGFGEYYVLGFWTANKSKLSKDNLYTWISEHGKILKEGYATQNRELEKFNIQGIARPGNNAQAKSYIGYNDIDYDISWPANITTEISDKSVSKISVYVSEGAKVEDFKIQATQGSSTISGIEGTLKEGWTHGIIVQKNSKVNFKLNGKLSIDKNKVDSGYAYVLYEREE